MKKTLRPVLLSIAVIFFLSQNAWSQKLYTWKDRNGVVHITTSPTQSELRQMKKAKVAKGKSGSAPVENRQAEPNKEQQFIKDAAAAQKHEKDQITKARKDTIDVLNTLNPGGR
jgi:hypothetical protein